MNDLEKLDKWPSVVKHLQSNWIGKSQGHSISFKVDQFGEKITVFTTRIDTLLGVTFLAVCIEHPIVETVLKNASEKEEQIRSFQRELQSQTLVDRSKDQTKKGLYLGVDAIHPTTNKKIPIWISNYVLPDYGTGAVMVNLNGPS